MPDTEKILEIIKGTRYGKEGKSIVGENFLESFLRKIADQLVSNGVAVQKNGRWLGEPGYFKCSCCGKYGGDCGYETSAYCPNCGAKMEE